MRKGWKLYLSLGLCLILLGSNSSFVYAAQVEEQYTEEILEETEVTEDVVEEEELTEEKLEEEKPVSADIKKVQRIADSNPIVSKEMPAVETLPEIVLGETYSAGYDKNAPYDTSVWMKFTPETEGIYRIITNAKSGSEAFWNTDASDVDTEYTYAEDGFFQYLEAGTTYVVKMNGEYYGNGVLEFSVTKAKEVSALKVTKAPDKSTYYNNFGEYIEVKGMKIKVSYADGTSETVTITESSRVNLKSGYTLSLDAYGKTIDICINGFESFPAIQYKVKFVNATGLTKYTSGNKIVFESGEKVKYFKFVPSVTAEYTMETIGMTNLSAYLYDSSTGEQTLSLTKGKTYHLRVENLSVVAGTAKVYLTKKDEENKKVLTGFKITKQPYQKEFYYKPGKSVEVCPAGMEVTAAYEDGTNEIIKFGYSRYAQNKEGTIEFRINKINISSPKEGTQTLTVSTVDYDFTDTYEVILKPYPDETQPLLETGITKIQAEPGKPLYYSYVIPEDGVYNIELSDMDSYEIRHSITVVGDSSNYWGGTKEFTEGMIVYFYLLNMTSEAMEVEISIQKLYGIGAEITGFEWTTEPEEEILAYYGRISAEGIITFSDGSKVQAGVPAVQQHVVDPTDYPIEINAEIVDGKDSSVLGEREITFTVGIKSGDDTEYIKVDTRTIEFTGPSNYNGGPTAAIKNDQSVHVDAAEIDDDYVVYKFVPTKTSAYRMFTVGEVGYESSHRYNIFREMDGKAECVDSTQVSGYYVDREVLTAGETYYVVFPLRASDNFSFVCRENKAVQGVSGYFSNELQLKNATAADVLKNAVITIYFKDGTSEKLDNSKWTYYSNAEGTGYYNADSYYNIYTANLGKTQGTTKKLTAERQMISVYQQMNYGYEVPIGYVKANGYKITFNKNNGTYLSKTSKVIESGKQLGTLPVSKRKGYVLKGWYTAKTGGTKFTAATKISKSRTLYAQWTKVTAPAKVKKPTLTNLSGKKMKVAYKKVTNAKGYQIVYSTSSKFTSAATKKVTVTSLNKTFTSLKKGKTYYVKVRAYKTDSYGNKVWGAYSTVNKIKIKK